MNKQPDGTIELSLTISHKDIQATKQKLIFEASKTLEIKGFRKGKAPLEVVEKHLDETKISQQVLDRLLPQKLAQELKSQNLNPISNPHLKVVSMKPNEDWHFTIEMAEFPQFELGNYQDKIRLSLKATKIWLPGERDTKAQSKDQSESEDQRLKKVFDTLLKEIAVTIPHLLITDEVNRALSRLLAQVQKLGLTIEQYLASLGKTSKGLRQEYETTAQDNLKLEFILQKIANDLNITIDDKDIDTMIAAVPDPKTRESFNTPSERAYIASVIRKRKTIDTLLKLA